MFYLQIICDPHTATSQPIDLKFVVCDAGIYGSQDSVTQMLPHRKGQVNKKCTAMWQIVGHVFYYGIL